MARKPLHVELGPNEQAIVERLIELGRYKNAGDVVQEALLILSEREAEFDEWLREEVREALADPRRPIPIEEAFGRARAHIALRAKNAKRDQ